MRYCFFHDLKVGRFDVLPLGQPAVRLRAEPYWELVKMTNDQRDNALTIGGEWARRNGCTCPGPAPGDDPAKNCQLHTDLPPELDSPLCPACMRNSGTPIKDQTTGDPLTDRWAGPDDASIWCPACGEGWVATDQQLARAQRSWEAYQRLEAGLREALPERSLCVIPEQLPLPMESAE